MFLKDPKAAARKPQKPKIWEVNRLDGNSFKSVIEEWCISSKVHVSEPSHYILRSGLFIVGEHPPQNPAKSLSRSRLQGCTKISLGWGSSDSSRPAAHPGLRGTYFLVGGRWEMGPESTGPRKSLSVHPVRPEGKPK